MLDLITIITLLAIGIWTIYQFKEMPREIIETWREINEFGNENGHIGTRAQKGNIQVCK